MDSEQLLAALRDDSEWPAATLRLLHTTLDSLEEAFQGEPERLGQVRELRRCLHRAGEAFNALLDRWGMARVIGSSSLHPIGGGVDLPCWIAMPGAIGGSWCRPPTIEGA